LHLDSDVVIRQLNVKVLAVGAKSLGNHLYAHFSVGYSAYCGRAVLVRLQFQAFFFLSSRLVQRMQDDFGIPDRLPVGIFYHYKIKARGWLLCLLLRCGSDYEGCQNESSKQAASHDRLLSLNLSRPRSYKDCRHSYDLPSANTLMHEHGR